LEENLKKWIDRVSIKRSELGGLSICPFAKKGVENKTVFYANIFNDPRAFMLNFIEIVNNFELIIFYNEDKTLTDDHLKCIIKDLQNVRPDMIFLKDHPDTPGYINGINTGNCVYPIILVQPRDKLIETREKLKKTKYYDYWDEDYLKEIWSYGSES
jgi:hypothetical protein